jgi:hypothetical protein
MFLIEKYVSYNSIYIGKTGLNYAALFALAPLVKMTQTDIALCVSCYARRPRQEGMT